MLRPSDPTRPALAALLAPFALFAAGLFAAGPARAQSGEAGDATDAERARLLTDAEAARDGNDHARALEIAVRAAALRTTPSLRLFIAQEQFALGRYAEASGSARQCQQDTRQNPGVANRERIELACTQLFERLRARIGLVVVRLPSGAPEGVVVRVNEQPLGEAFYGVPYVVNPGLVRVELVYPSGARRSVERGVEPGRTVEVALEPPATSPEVGVGAPAPGPTVGLGAPASHGPSLAPPLAVLVAGGAVAALAPLLLLPRDAALAALRSDHCDAVGGDPADLQCDPTDEARGAWSSAQGFHAATIALGAAGGAAALAGGAWLLVRALAAPRGAAPTVALDGGPAGLRLLVRFDAGPAPRARPR